jgi:F-type H+-transporting ATPase subunit alpha
LPSTASWLPSPSSAATSTATQRQLTRGERMVEVLKQDQYVPMAMEKQVAIIFAASEGALDDVPADGVRAWEADFLAFLDEKHAGVLHSLEQSGKLDDGIVEHLRAAIKEFKAAR